MASFEILSLDQCMIFLKLVHALTSPWIDDAELKEPNEAATIH